MSSLVIHLHICHSQVHARTGIYYTTDSMGPQTACTWPRWPDTVFAAIFDTHFLYTHTITGIPSSFCFHFCRCRSGATPLKLSKDTGETMNHKCVLIQPQALAVHWLHWARGHGGERAGEPDNAAALSPEVNAVCECPQTAEYTHSRENTLLVHVNPQKWAV